MSSLLLRLSACDCSYRLPDSWAKLRKRPRTPLLEENFDRLPGMHFLGIHPFDVCQHSYFWELIKFDPGNDVGDKAAKWNIQSLSNHDEAVDPSAARCISECETVTETCLADTFGRVLQVTARFAFLDHENAAISSFPEGQTHRVRYGAYRGGRPGCRSITHSWTQDLQKRCEKSNTCITISGCGAEFNEQRERRRQT